MRRIITILVLGIITSGYGFSQTSVWEINKGEKKIYLGGSVHILRSGDFPLPREFDVAFSSANVLVLEADIKDPAMMNKILKEGILPDKLTLKSVLTKLQYTTISRTAYEIGVPIMMIEKMKPAMALMSLNAITVQKIGATEQGVDMYYYDKAIAQNKEVNFLESIDFQINLICNNPFVLDEFIEYSIDGMRKLNTKSKFGNFIKSWRTGKTASEKEINAMKEKYPSVYKVMLLDRNYKWLPTIEKYFEDDKTMFVLVGAAHLWGSDGLLNLLKEKGYEITQLRVNK